jgi:hypothetical protein
MSYGTNAPVGRLAHDELYQVCCYDGTIRVTTAVNEVLDVSSRMSVRSRYTYIPDIRSKAHLGSTSSDAVAVMRTVTAPFLLGSTGVVEPRLIVH